MRTIQRLPAMLLVVATLMTQASSSHGQEGVSQVLKPLIANHDGEVAVAIQILDSENKLLESWSYRGSEVMPTASLIKLPVMIEAYRQEYEALIDMDELLTLDEASKVPGSGILTQHFSAGAQLPLRDVVRLMIRYSDNTATNLLLERIGLASTNRTMAELGYPETRIHSMVFRRDTSLDVGRSEKFGLGSTRAIDMVELIVKLERGELISQPACTEILAHLLSCEDTGRFPRFLPPGTRVAHKTGAVSRTRAAAGVIYAPAHKIVLCVLTDENADTSWSNDNAAHLLCANLAKAAYDFVGRKGKSSDRQLLAMESSGELVEALQRTLNSRLDIELSVDGDFGPATEAAVKQFQQAAELEPNGIVDQETWAALGELESEQAIDPPEVVNSRSQERSPPLDPSGPPAVTARAYAIVDAVSGEVLAAQQADAPLPNASTTKLMTALLVAEYAAEHPECLDEVVTFSERADKTGGSSAGIRTGEQVTVAELLYGLLLPSGNDAAVAIAEHFGPRVLSEAPEGQEAYDSFIEAMNEQAIALNLTATHFDNPHGLTADGHHSSAVDLAQLARAVMRYPLLREVVNCPQRGCRVTSRLGYSRNVLWKNTNQLLNQEGFFGLKTGTTNAAGACLVAIGQREENEVIVVVLGAANSAARYVDARNLFAWTWRETGL